MSFPGRTAVPGVRAGGAAGALAYLDTSAYVKLVLREPEHDALRQALVRWPARISSVLLRVEAERACARYGEQPWVQEAQAGLRALSLLPLDERVVRAAAGLRPAGLRTLDAIHLATALSTGRRLGVLFSYDERLCAAASDAGVPVQRPA